MAGNGQPGVSPGFEAATLFGLRFLIIVRTLHNAADATSAIISKGRMTSCVS